MPIVEVMISGHFFMILNFFAFSIFPSSFLAVWNAYCLTRTLKHKFFDTLNYRISAISTRGYYSLLAFLVRVIFKGGSYLRFSK